MCHKTRVFLRSKYAMKSKLHGSQCRSPEVELKMWGGGFESGGKRGVTNRGGCLVIGDGILSALFSLLAAVSEIGPSPFLFVCACACKENGRIAHSSWARPICFLRTHLATTGELFGQPNLCFTEAIPIGRSTRERFAPAQATDGVGRPISG
jgi:hypothetical protein